MAVESASREPFMKTLVLILALACASCIGQAAADKDVAALQKQADGITIIRDTWGIQHFYGKGSASAPSALRRDKPQKEATQALAEPIPAYIEPTGSNGAAIAPSN